MMNSLLFALLAGVCLQNFNHQYSVLIVLCVTFFAVLEFTARGRDARGCNLFQLTLVLLVIFLVTVGPLLLEIYLRRLTAPYEHIHDGALQAEEAIRFLLEGKNPYGADYSQTPLALWMKDYGNYPNPALRNYAYLPLTVLLPIPFYVLVQAMLGWFDIRFLFLLCFVLLLFLLPRLVATWERRFGLLITFGLNPLFTPFFVQGRNDVLILTAIVGSIFFLQRRKIGAAAMVLGVACAAKQTAWFVVPFFLGEAYFILSNGRAWIRRAVLPVVFPFALVLFPFVLWDAWAHLRWQYRDADSIAATLRERGYTHVLLNRAGLDFMLQTGNDPISLEDVRLLEEFVARHLQQVYGKASLQITRREGKPAVGGMPADAYTVYAIREQAK